MGLGTYRICARASFTYLNVDVEVSSTARSLNSGPSLYLYPYFVYASSACSGESVHMRSLT